MALTGVHLKVAGDSWFPWMHFPEDSAENPTGAAWDLFLILSKHLNFTYTLVRSVDNLWGNNYQNGTITGMVGMVHRKEVDMAIGPFDRTYSRAMVVDYSKAIYSDIYTLLLPRPRLEKDPRSILKPFSLTVWCGIIVFILLASILGSLLQKSPFVQTIISEKSKNGKKGVFFQPFWVIQTLTNDVICSEPATDSAKIFLCTLYLVSLFLSTAYSGLLTSLLAVPTVNIPVDSLQELVDYGKIPWAVEYGTAMMGHIQNEMNGSNILLKTVGEKMLFVPNCYRGKRRVIDEGIALICDSLAIKNIMNEEFSENGTCSYYMAKDQILTSSLSFVFPQGSYLKSIFDHWLLALRGAGIIEKSVYNFFHNTTTCLQRPGTEQKNNLVVFDIEQLSGIFLLLIIGLALAFVYQVLEWLAFKMKKNISK